jgi:hypothetical protein
VPNLRLSRWEHCRDEKIVIIVASPFERPILDRASVFPRTSALYLLTDQLVDISERQWKRRAAKDEARDRDRHSGYSMRLKLVEALANNRRSPLLGTKRT